LVSRKTHQKDPRRKLRKRKKNTSESSKKKDQSQRQEIKQGDKKISQKVLIHGKMEKSSKEE
jgi:hypothetical protein